MANKTKTKQNKHKPKNNSFESVFFDLSEPLNPVIPATLVQNLWFTVC